MTEKDFYWHLTHTPVPCPFCGKDLQVLSRVMFDAFNCPSCKQPVPSLRRRDYLKKEYTKALMG